MLTAYTKSKTTKRSVPLWLYSYELFQRWTLGSQWWNTPSSLLFLAVPSLICNVLLTSVSCPFQYPWAPLPGLLNLPKLFLQDAHLIEWIHAGTLLLNTVMSSYK